jgi:transcriptional regulator with XRE-family HTH domain
MSHRATTVTPDARRLAALRERAGLTQQEVADRLCRTRTHVVHHENGRPTSKGSLAALAWLYRSLLGDDTITVDSLITPETASKAA